MTTETHGSTRCADQPADFQRFNVNPQVIEPWEDGQRIDVLPGHFEWWYADARFEQPDITMSIVFFTKPFFMPGMAMHPVVKVGVFRNGQSKVWTGIFQDGVIDTQGCKVQFGPCRFEGDLERYDIVVELDGCKVALSLQRTVPGFRLGTGHRLFLKGGIEHYFAWLPAVPLATASAKLELDGELLAVRDGQGYHDHNWGNADMASLMHHWVWSRAQLGPYTVIAAHITPQPDYGSDPIAVFEVLKDGQRVVSAPSGTVGFSRLDDSALNAETGKYIPQTLVYTVTANACVFTLTICRTKTVQAFRFPNAPVGSDPDVGGAYHRFECDCQFTLQPESGPIESHSTRSSFELMFFGRPAAGLPAAPVEQVAVFEQVMNSLASAHFVG